MPGSASLVNVRRIANRVEIDETATNPDFVLDLDWRLAGGEGLFAGCQAPLNKGKGIFTYMERFGVNHSCFHSVTDPYPVLKTMFARVNDTCEGAVGYRIVSAKLQIWGLSFFWLVKKWKDFNKKRATIDGEGSWGHVLNRLGQPGDNKRHYARISSTGAGVGGGAGAATGAKHAWTRPHC